MATTTDEKKPSSNPVVNVRAFGNKIAKSAVATAKADDPFEPLYTDADGIIRPPYDLYGLSAMVDMSNILGQCIWAMALNVDGMGYQLNPAPWAKDIVEKDADAQAEKRLLMRLFRYPNPDADLTEIRLRLRFDLESNGMGALELVPDFNGEIAEIYHVPSHSIRICKQDPEPTDFTQFVRDDDGKYEAIPRRKRFRRFCQYLGGKNKKVFFKELADPRIIDATTGKEDPGTSNPANPLMLFTLYASHSLYGLPRWIGQMIDIIGSRKASEVNFMFFDNKSIPPFVITVSGGVLAQEMIDKLEAFFKYESKGTENFHKGLIIEAAPADAGAVAGEKAAQVKIDIKPLTQFIDKDALWREYRKDVATGVISAFRFGPMFAGMSQDYTRATADASQRAAEEQVFQPERNRFDLRINTELFSNLGINYWEFKSLGVNTADDTQIVGAMAGVQQVLTVREVREAVSRMRNVPMIELPPELDQMSVSEFIAQHQPAIPILDPTAGDKPTGKGEPNAEQVVKSLMRIRKSLADAFPEAEVTVSGEAA